MDIFPPAKQRPGRKERALVVMPSTRALACSTRISNLSSGRSASFCHFADWVKVTPISFKVGPPRKSLSTDEGFSGGRPALAFSLSP